MSVFVVSNPIETVGTGKNNSGIRLEGRRGKSLFNIFISRNKAVSKPTIFITRFPHQTPLSTLPGLDGRSLTQLLSALDPFLVSVTVDSSARLSRLSSSRLARAANQRAVRDFVRAYQRISEAVEDPANEYEYPATILPRTVEEVETILLLE